MRRVVDTSQFPNGWAVAFGYVGNMAACWLFAQDDPDNFVRIGDGLVWSELGDGTKLRDEVAKLCSPDQMGRWDGRALAPAGARPSRAALACASGLVDAAGAVSAPLAPFLPPSEGIERRPRRAKAEPVWKRMLRERRERRGR